ncbi:MAG: aminotransferase class I/II-fold pyridoxal phosphate-dependent enzyme, partial [Acidimicrobiales bacterium]
MTWPPPYPYDRLNELKSLGEKFAGGLVDLSIGRPSDAPPDAVVAALSTSGQERGYPPSIGSAALRAAATGWLRRRFDIAIEPSQVAACIGTKEFVAALPGLLHLRTPERDTVLYPEVSYPSYAMGARLARLRSVAVPVDAHWRLDLSRIDPADAERALCLWVNTPGNPAGGLDDLGAVAEWGRSRNVPIFSDECYIEFTWDGPPRSVLQHGVDGVVALHSLSKRSNLAGVRAGFYAGDPELVHYISECRKHTGMMPPGPNQHAAIVAFGDDAHVDEQRLRYLERLNRLVEILGHLDIAAQLPAGAFYLWVSAPDGDGWAL